jgi:rsbT co-antagonist protein RsbR
MDRVIEAFEQHLDSVVGQSIEQIILSGHPFYSKLPQAILQGAVGNAFKSVLVDLRQGSDTNFARFLAQASKQRVEQGASPSDVISGFNVGIDTVSAFFKAHFAEDHAALAWWFERIHHISQHAAITLSESMIAIREDRIQEQNLMIRETSTPIMPIYEGILVLPLVGSVDTHRAGQVMDNLLQGITEHQADVVILDITGVPVVDTGVAHHILQVARAARLLGTEVVLVGIGPEIAQTIVQLGVDLSDITTRAHLQAGMSYALGRQQLVIRLA